MASDGSIARPSRPGGDAGLREALRCRSREAAAVDLALGLPSIAAARDRAREGLTTAGGRGRGQARRRMRALGPAATETEAVRPRILPPTSRNDGPAGWRRPAIERGDDALEKRRRWRKTTPARLGEADRLAVSRRRALSARTLDGSGQARGPRRNPAATGGGRYHYRVPGRIGKQDRHGCPARSCRAARGPARYGPKIGTGPKINRTDRPGPSGPAPSSTQGRARCADGTARIRPCRRPPSRRLDSAGRPAPALFKAARPALDWGETCRSRRRPGPETIGLPVLLCTYDDFH